MQKSLRNYLVNILIFLSITVSAMASNKKVLQTPVIIEARPTIQLINDKIYLRDIANITGPDTLKESIGAISLGNAPRPSKKRIISSTRLTSIIKSKNWIPEDVNIITPEVVKIERAFQTVDSVRLEQFFYDFVEANINASTFEITDFKIRGSKAFPYGAIELEIARYRKRRITGRINLPVNVIINGTKQGRIILSAWINCYENIVCANRNLSRDHTIQKDDISLRSINISRISSNFLTSIDDTIDKQLTSHIKAGEYIRENNLTIAPIISRGDKVRILLEKGNLRLVTFGIAKSDGVKDGQILIENMKSKKKITGHVVDATTVKVIF